MNRQSSGTSLTEIMVALFVLGLVITPMLNMMLNSNMTIAVGADDLEIIALGTAFVDQMKLLHPAALPVRDREELKLLDNGELDLAGIPGNPEIIMPSWNPQTVTLEFQIENMQLPTKLSGEAREGRLVTLYVSSVKEGRPKRTVSFSLLISDV